MPDYSQGKIYKIECNITNDVYYGSTVQSLSERLLKHKSKRDCSAIDIIDRGNFNMKVIEEFPCNRRQELEARESYYIRNNLCINKQIPGRTQEEWYQDNKEYAKQQSKKYNEENKGRKKENDKKYRENNKEIIKSKQNQVFTCVCGNNYTRSNYQQHIKSKKHQNYLITLT